LSELWTLHSAPYSMLYATSSSWPSFVFAPPFGMLSFSQSMIDM
jgi:hypothetical protein